MPTLPPSDHREQPGRKQGVGGRLIDAFFSVRGSLSFLAGGVAVVLGLLLVLAVPSYDTSTTATVVGHSPGRQECDAQLEFEVDGETYDVVAPGRCPEDDGWAVGDEVPVYYDPGSPSDSSAESSAATPGYVALGVGAILLGVGLRQRRRPKR